jgi:hypothetical protein
MSMNLVAIWAYDYLVVNGVRKYLAKKKRADRPVKIVSIDDVEKKENTGSGSSEEIKKNAASA